jgi:hypothetical protein
MLMLMLSGVGLTCWEEYRNKLVTTGITYGEFSVLCFFTLIGHPILHDFSLERKNWIACWLLCKF